MVTLSILFTLCVDMFACAACDRPLALKQMLRGELVDVNTTVYFIIHRCSFQMSVTGKVTRQTHSSAESESYLMSWST